ncbi:hypothetical protein NDU88_000964 [Pleurodeles waltl]|uniref:Uncharacterized protein n=1 Tax=Pleurodeles waltl TaxID=8319 RepID=A0AAV7Q2A8_PLEWA|nr:hypothetical protein NDU88_000964 [Pleurodeles waltl]
MQSVGLDWKGKGKRRVFRELKSPIDYKYCEIKDEKMKLFKALKSAMKGESYIKASVGEETPPEGTPAYIVMEERGVAPCLWLKQWHKLTEKHGSAAFPIHGTFNIRILENLRFAMYDMKVPPRPAQFEALAIWELMARQQQQKKFETRIRKAEKTLADARWDNAQKVRYIAGDKIVSRNY